MARKKTTGTKKAEEEVEETTEKEVKETKTTAKKSNVPKMIPITFKPQFSAATKKSINLNKEGLIIKLHQRFLFENFFI